MSTRKSTRLRNVPAQEPAKDEQQQPAAPKSAGTKKVPASKVKKASAQGGSGSKTSIAKSTTTKGKKPQVQAQLSSSKHSISNMPPEILRMTLDNIKDLSTISALGRSCKKFYSLMMPRLYGLVTVAAMFHAHIPKLIRTLEPHLTIKQKKQLKKEGKYKGQQERYESGLDESAKPICATHVRRMVVGVADPGKKHKYIVERYVEEALKNMDNLEIVETRMLTKSIGKSIASLKSLKALSLLTEEFEDEDIKPLVNIKNLQHLSLQYYGYSDTFYNFTRTLLQNSSSTLRSLHLATSSYRDLFLQTSEEEISANDGITDDKYGLTALKSLTIDGLTFDENDITSVHRSINFMHLHDLTIEHHEGNIGFFFDSLTTLATASQATGTGINLRSLNVRMSSNGYLSTAEKKKANIAAKCRFISSFNTLTTLVVNEYGQYPSAIAINPGLPDMVLQAILKHKHLRTLEISYAGMTSQMKIPYLNATTVGAIIDGLPHLQQFEFAPEENQMDEIGPALARGPNLTTITCFPHDSWATHPEPDEPGMSILKGILKALLDQASSTPPKAKFIWEDHYKLRRISVRYKAWDVATEFMKSGRGGGPKAAKMLSSDGNRSVFFRLVPPVQYIHVGYDPEHRWVEKVDRDIV